MKLKGKKALVIAAGQGIGRAIAEAFQREGAEVLGATLHPEKLQGVVPAVRLDARDKEAVFHLIQGLDRLDVLVNAQGVVPVGGLLEATDQDWEEAFLLNAKSVFWAMQAALPKMAAQGGGSVINIASVAGKDGNPNASAYSASKAAVIALTKSLGKELADTGVRVNCVTPAAVKTAIFDQMSPEHIAFMLSKIPMGRFGTPEEVAAMVAWLCTDDCSFSTGAVFDLSGGRATY